MRRNSTGLCNDWLPSTGRNVTGHMRKSTEAAFAGAVEQRKLDDAEKKLGRWNRHGGIYDLIDQMGAWEEQLASTNRKR